MNLLESNELARLAVTSFEDLEVCVRADLRKGRVIALLLHMCPHLAMEIIISIC